MLNVLYNECLHYAILFHTEDEMCLLLQNTLQWDVDNIILQRIPALSEYYALSPIIDFNRLILSDELFVHLTKSSFASYLFSLFVFLTTSSDAVHNLSVPSLLKEINALKQTITNSTELYRIVRSSLLFWFLFLQLATPYSILFQSDSHGNRETDWNEADSEANWLFVIKIAMSLNATAVMHAVDFAVPCLLNRHSSWFSSSQRRNRHLRYLCPIHSFSFSNALKRASRMLDLCLLGLVYNGLKWKPSQRRC